MPVFAAVLSESFSLADFQETGTDAERAEKRRLQIAHRERVTHGTFEDTPLNGRVKRTSNSTVTSQREMLRALAGTIRRIIGSDPRGQQVADQLDFRASLHQLPARPTGFVGRSADLAALRAHSDQPTVLTGLRGMGGIGKTALGLVLAHEWTPRFPDAQLFLDGQGTHANPASPESLLTQIIAAFHPDAAKNLPTDLPSLQAICHQQVLHGRRVLILLDNAKDTAQARPLIPPAGCALIVTSRSSIMLGTARPHDVGRLPADEATALLREFHPTLSDGDAAALVRLCAGLPLALRLAGAHLALDGDAPAYIKALGSGRLSALDAEAPDAGEVTISETLRLSEDALTPEQRAAWRALGIFQHSFDERAAAAVIAAQNPPDAQSEIRNPQSPILPLLTRRSLVEKVGERYQLHDLAAEYARAQLGTATCETLRLAHARHYTQIGEEAEALYLAGQPVPGLALLDAERLQIEAAYGWLRSIGFLACDAAPAEPALTKRPEHRLKSLCYAQLTALIDSIALTSDLRFHPRQRIIWLETQAHAARLIPDRAAEGRALGNLGLAHADLGDARKAMEYHEQALVVSREIGDRRAEGSILGNLGSAHADLGDARKAMEFYEQQLVITREIGDRRGEGNALWNSADELMKLGERAEALSRARAALAIFEAIESPNAPKVRAALGRWEAEG